MPAVLAEDEDRTTAKDVVDAEPDMFQDNLKKFVQSARDHFHQNSHSVRCWRREDILQEEGGDWNYKSMYLVVLTRGTVSSYARRRSE